MDQLTPMKSSKKKTKNKYWLQFDTEEKHNIKWINIFFNTKLFSNFFAKSIFYNTVYVSLIQGGGHRKLKSER